MPPKGLDPQALQFLVAVGNLSKGDENEDCMHTLLVDLSGLDPRA